MNRDLLFPITLSPALEFQPLPDGHVWLWPLDRLCGFVTKA